MQRRAAVLRQRVGELERVELHVGVAVREAFDEGGDGLGGAGGGGGDAVADVEDVLPVLAREVLVGRLDCGSVLAYILGQAVEWYVAQAAAFASSRVWECEG